MADLIAMMAAAAGASAEAGDYEISRSLRFNSADSAYLSRTPASAGNRKTWTWSGWVKRSAVGASSAALFSVNTASGTTGYTAFFFQGSVNNLYFETREAGGGKVWETTPVYRDASAWYHIVLAVDTSQATATNRVKMYVNGTQITAFSTQNTITLDFLTSVNDTVSHDIGVARDSGGTRVGYFNGYMTDINFIDGQALTPSSFGEVNADTGVWSPIKYAGTYGTNGFHLEFADNSDVTATTLGKDTSGNGNNWTPSGSPGFSVTAGAGNDSLVDSPTRYGTDTGAGGEVRGNYCTLNPLATGGGVLFNGNLTITSNGHYTSTGTMAFPKGSGKIYFEATATAVSGSGIGVAVLTTPFINTYPGATANIWWFYDNGSNFAIFNQTSSNSYASRISAGQVWQIAYDAATGKVFLGVNNTWINSTNGTDGDPANGSNPTFTISTSADIFPFVETAGNAQWDVNFGQRPFAYTAPSGFKALCTTNLPDPTVVQGDDYFNTVLYTGTGSSLGVTGVGFQPDFVWIKERNAAADHGLYDAVRGVTKQLESNTTDAETTEATGLTAFGTDGFTIGALAQLNTSADTYVAWNWKANGAGSSNTDGTITSTVSANTTAGISIMTWSGTGANGTIGHGLGVAPGLVIVKNRNDVGRWRVWHKTFNGDQFLYLDGTEAVGTQATLWNSTVPSATVISAGTSGDINWSGRTYVGYCFAEVEGFSKAFSFVGNNSTDGPMVWTGFKPAWVLYKASSISGNWLLVDAVRNKFNVVNSLLIADVSNAENSANSVVDFLSNGFKVRQTGSTYNASGETYIGIAFASNPFKYALAR